MSLKAGSFLWRRMRLTLDAGTTLGPSTVSVNTGLRQPNLDFPTYSVGEPSLGTGGVAPPADGTPPASRIQVVPLGPTMTGWASVAHSEPYLNTTTNTINVTFTNAAFTEVTINVLFWDPHSIIGPGAADTYFEED